MKVAHLITVAEDWPARKKLKKAPPVLPSNKDVLTKREIEIIKLMFDDYNTNEIAWELSISTRTVDTHRKNMLRKTGIQSTIGLIKYALVRGLIRLE
ncbi:helix-turn-helix transcriptional regulator [Rhodocytophaga rosea]|uniref:Helix-turn-helix transcriptional regulator n=1 Tax=Rhodocytophaga rosea TaxID=2704465 RepID=A0A6C0GIU4_9BACT|nr:helix-turn-helix transcriptional regulator [Rhodocytophaga rosea]QHT67764.1 helix-turn-helix transcriptional regulator [Rhodocytophaga rosea]